MSIERFDQGALGPALVAYYNPTDGVPVVDEDDYIISMPDGYGVGPTLVQRSETEKVKYVAGTKIGEMEAITADERSECGLVGELDEDILYVEGTTVFSIFEAATGDVWAWHHMEKAGGDNNRLGIRRNWTGEDGSFLHYVHRTGSAFVGRPSFSYNEPTITALRLQGESLDDPSRLYESRVESATHGVQLGSTDSSVYPERIGHISLGCSQNYLHGLQGNLALHVVYNRGLTDSEVDDVLELCRYWYDNGQAPGIDYPPNTDFGPVLSTDTAATLIWEVWLDSDPTENWQPVSVLSDVTIVDEDVEGVDMTGTGNKVLINSAQLSDSCQIRCVAYNEGNVDGLASDIARLAVQETP